MASSSSSEPTLEQRQKMTQSYQSFIHNTSIAMLFVAPALMALPPRKLDLYTFTLVGAFALSGNQLIRENNGVGLLGLLPGRPFAKSSKAEEAWDKVRVETERSRLLEESLKSSPGALEATEKGGVRPGSLEAKAKEMWMGGETEGWKERRLKEEQEKIDNGEGYGSMIMDQIWEVWNWGEKKAEQLEEKDREVLKEKERVKKEARRNEEFPIIGKGG